MTSRLDERGQPRIVASIGFAAASCVVAGVGFIYKMTEFATTIVNDDVEGFGAVAVAIYLIGMLPLLFLTLWAVLHRALPRHRAAEVPHVRARPRDRARRRAGEPPCLTATPSGTAARAPGPIVAAPRRESGRRVASRQRARRRRYHIYESNPAPWWIGLLWLVLLHLRRHLPDPQPAGLTRRDLRRAARIAACRCGTACRRCGGTVARRRASGSAATAACSRCR